MRLFIAIPLPDEVKDNALLLQDVLDEKDFRSVKKANLEMTIAFFGEKPEAESIIRKLKRIRFNSFKLKTEGIGFFPSENKIRVIWIGLEENEEFFRLQHDIRSLFDFKEKLMPHITIARARQPIIDKENKISRMMNKNMGEKNYSDKEFIIDRFVLYESVPGPGGYTHMIIEDFLSNNFSK